MTYKIYTTNGNLLTEIPDGTFDSETTSLTLFGKNVTNFGSAVNENFVNLLENFAASSEPSQAITGQLWYDTSTGRLNVYDGTAFRASGGPLISAIQPVNKVPGDLWINNETNQLWFYDGADWILAGPQYTNQQGESGFKVESILDNLNRSRVVVKLFSNNTLLGIFSSVAFTPLFPIPGFGTTIGIGFTASTLSGLKFDVTVSKAEKLITSLGEEKVADDLVFNNEDAVIDGSLTIQSQDGIRLLGGTTGTNVNALGDVFLTLESGNFVLENAESGRSVEIRTKRPIEGSKTAMYIDAVTQRVGFFNTQPEVEVDITGSLKISGDLIVEGETLSISVSNVSLQDKNIELNKPEVGSATDALADGGGVILKGSTDKTITYSTSASSWNSSEHWNLVSGKEYRINGTKVIDSTTLGSTVINSSLKTLGNLTTINMVKGLSTGINITEDTITGSGNLVLTSSTGNVSVNNKKIINLADLDFSTSAGSDAANKRYVDSRIYVRPIALTVDISNFDITTEAGEEAANAHIISNVLNKISPIYDPVTNVEGMSVEGTIARVHCTSTTVGVENITYMPVKVGDKNQIQETEAYTSVAVDRAGGSENQAVVQDIVAVQVIPAPVATVQITTINKKFKVIRQPNMSLLWEWVENF